MANRTLAVGGLIHRATRARQRQEWLQAGQVGLSAAMLGDKTVRQLGDSILDFLAPYLGAQAGVIFTGEGEAFERQAQLGVPGDAAIPERFAVREGLLGRVAADGRAVVLRDVPEGYLTVGSALGRDKPRHLVIAPFNADGMAGAVMGLDTQLSDDAVETFLDQAVAGVQVGRPAHRALPHRAAEPARGDPAPGRGAAGPERGAARLQRRA